MKTPIRVLVVEDEAVTAMDLKAILLQLGYQVPAVVGFGEEAVRQAVELKPDLILMDITLAGSMSGIEAAEAIRQVQHTPVIYLTAHSDNETLERAKLTEPFGYLAKPCGVNALVTTIEMALYKFAVDKERRAMEEALRQSEEKYRTVADFTHDWEFWIAPDGGIIYSSPSCARITGYPATAFQQDPDLLRRLVVEEDLPRYDQHRHQCTATAQQSIEFEFRINRADGAVCWISHVCQPVFDSRGMFVGTRGSNRDVTERKRLEAEAAKARNLEALGILAGGIAHDFNNLFQALLGNISLAQMNLPETSEAYQFLQKAEQVYSLAAKLTGQLVAFASGGISIRVDIEPARFLQQTVGEVTGAGVTVELDLGDNLARINADPAQFTQVIKHLMTNATEAMPHGGVLRVSAVNAVVLANTAGPPLVPGNYLQVSFQDQGSGIRAEDLPRIFDPYFSTKERGAQKGMGLGLSLCSTIIQKHGGTITVESELGRGTTFHLFLPVIAVDTGKGAVRQESGGHGPRVLVMDDDPGVLQVAARFLQHAGYRVDTAPHGEAVANAYHEALANGDPYALVILDLAIPDGLGAMETISLLQKIDPQVKAIVSSGYVADPAMTDFADYGFVAAVEKPYRFMRLKEILDRLLVSTGEGGA